MVQRLSTLPVIASMNDLLANGVAVPDLGDVGEIVSPLTPLMTP